MISSKEEKKIPRQKGQKSKYVRLQKEEKSKFGRLKRREQQMLSFKKKAIVVKKREKEMPSSRRKDRPMNEKAKCRKNKWGRSWKREKINIFGDTNFEQKTLRN